MKIKVPHPLMGAGHRREREGWEFQVSRLVDGGAHSFPVLLGQWLPLGKWMTSSAGAVTWKPQVDGASGQNRKASVPSTLLSRRNSWFWVWTESPLRTGVTLPEGGSVELESFSLFSTPTRVSAYSVQSVGSGCDHPAGRWQDRCHHYVLQREETEAQRGRTRTPKSMLCLSASLDAIEHGNFFFPKFSKSNSSTHRASRVWGTILSPMPLPQTSRTEGCGFLSHGWDASLLAWTSSPGSKCIGALLWAGHWSRSWGPQNDEVATSVLHRTQLRHLPKSLQKQAG